MRRAWFTCIVLWALAATLGCRSPSADWNGTWRLNPSKSNFQSRVFTISISADGEYRLDDASLSFTFWCDGKDRPIGKNRTRACVKSSATALDLTQKENGVKTSTDHWELSANGEVFMSTATTFRPSGPVATGQMPASRISGSIGFAGQWRDTSYIQRHSDLTLRLDSQTLHLSYPSAGQYVDATFDGVDATVHGIPAPEKMTYSVRLAGRREIHTLTKRSGKALTQGSMVLSDDGRDITYSWWSPGRPTDKNTLVYERK
jgi:hypothetical protein